MQRVQSAKKPSLKLLLLRVKARMVLPLPLRQVRGLLRRERNFLLPVRFRGELLLRARAGTALLLRMKAARRSLPLHVSDGPFAIS